MTTNILSYTRKYCCLMLLALPLSLQAQQSFERQKDSMKRAFMRKDSLRRQSVPQDTVKNVLIKSPFFVIYNTTTSVISGIQKISLQGIRFRHSHFLNLVINAGLTKPVNVSEQSKLYLALADGKNIILTISGGARSKGNGKNSSDLKLMYNLPDSEFKRLLNGNIVSIKMEYDGGAWVFDINNAAAGNIKRACFLTK
jgi:hypothetical protein